MRCFKIRIDLFCWFKSLVLKKETEAKALRCHRALDNRLKYAASTRNKMRITGRILMFAHFAPDIS